MENISYKPRWVNLYGYICAKIMHADMRHAHPSGIVDAYKKKVLIVTIILNHQYNMSIS
jgi:hypothetical protein